MKHTLIFILLIIVITNKNLYCFYFEDDGYYSTENDNPNLEPDTNYEPTKPNWYPVDVFEGAAYHLSYLKGASLSSNAISEEEPSKECINTYNNLYKNKIINFSIFYGYTNFGENVVFDRYQKQMLINHLLKPCTENYFSCGFEIIDSNDYADTLFKSIIGPDGDKKSIIVTIRDSSISDYNNWNTNDFIHDQVNKSNETFLAFEKALQNSEVVFYKGHSRKGAGPGFTPLYKNYFEYILKRFFKHYRKKMVKSLSLEKSNLKLFGYLGCSTKKYYEKYIHSSNPHLGLILTNFKSKVAETNFTLLASLNSLLGMRCEKDFSKSINFYRYNRPHRFKSFKERQNVSLDNFFK